MNDSLLIPSLTCLELRGGTPRAFAAPPARVVLCLGNFDGVHVAHAALLRQGVELAKALSSVRGETVSCGVLCFRRPSSDFFRSAEAPPHHLTTLEEKLALIAALGVEHAYLCDFEEVRDLEPTDFLTLLETRLGCVGAVCGFNHRFGVGASGHVAHLRAHFGQDAVVLMPALAPDGVTVSSSAIRDRLWAGDPEGAARLLGRPYALCTEVTAGKQLGRVLGFPTANQDFPAESLIPAHGVYAALCHTEEGIFPAVANVGSRPTVDGEPHIRRINCESYLIGYSGDLYGKRVRTELIAYLRPEIRFADVDALKDAIARDAHDAEAYLCRRGLIP